MLDQENNDQNSFRVSGIVSECLTVWIEIRLPDLGSNCLQQLSADDTCGQRLKDDYDHENMTRKYTITDWRDHWSF